MVWIGIWGALVASGCSGERLVVGDEQEATGSSGAAGSGKTGAGGSSGTGSAGAGSGGAASGAAGSGADAPGDIECPCSRRVEGSGWGCDLGEDKETEAEIGPNGGSAILDGTEATLGASVEVTFPAGALAETLTVRITELSEPPPAEYVDYSPLYLLEPTGAEFEKPATLRVPWSNSLESIDPALAIYRGDAPEGPFEIIDDNYLNAGFNQGKLTKLGYLFVGYPKSEEHAACP